MKAEITLLLVMCLSQQHNIIAPLTGGFSEYLNIGGILLTDKKIIEIELSERDENFLIKLIKKLIRRLTRKESERVREVTIKKTPLGKWKEITEIIDIILTGPLQKILEQEGI